jgi:hypothetical protein
MSVSAPCQKALDLPIDQPTLGEDKPDLILGQLQVRWSGRRMEVREHQRVLAAHHVAARVGRGGRRKQGPLTDGLSEGALLKRQAIRPRGRCRLW